MIMQHVQLDFLLILDYHKHVWKHSSFYDMWSTDLEIQQVFSEKKKKKGKVALQ